MNLVPYVEQRFWSPFRTLDALRKEIDRVFDRSILGDMEGLFSETTFVPSTDIYEDYDKVVVTVELPGMEQKDIDVSVSDRILSIKGERKQEHEEKGRNWHRVERSYGKFSRSFALPEGVDPTKVTARYKNGILEVVAPKAEQAKTTKVPVEVK